MTGEYFKKWAEDKQIKHHKLATALGISKATLYNLFRSKLLDKRTELAVGALGCAEPKKQRAG